VRQIFWSTLGLPPEKRDSYLIELCDIPAVINEVRSLLAHVGIPPDGANWEDIPVSCIEQGDLIEGYRVIREIATGGMGIVYEAQQTSPNRTVALKLLRPEIASSDLMNRLQLEGEILGAMQHPSIASVFSCGVTEIRNRKHPYIAMEYIHNATSIDQYVSLHKLSMKDRLQLFLDVCNSIIHAHRLGVIHRDIKPSNVLVDQDGQPKLIDFGVAHAGGVQPSNLTWTAPECLLGTLAYMAPEQLTGTQSSPSVSMDVYALGALLYIIVTGQQMHQIEGVSLWTAIQRIRSGNFSAPREVTPSVSKDLDAIINLCTQVNPDDRYSNVSDLHNDIVKLLNGTPVEARSPTALHRLRLLCNRHPGASLFACISILTLIVGSVISLRYANRESAARADTIMTSDRLMRMTEVILEDVFGAANPRVAGGKALTIAEAIELASTRLNKIAEPDVRGSVEARIAMILAEIDENERSIDHASNAVELLSKAHRNIDLEELAYAHRAFALALSNEGDYQQAAEQLDHAYQLLYNIHGDSHPDVALIIGAQASLLTVTGEPLKAVQLALSAELLAVEHFHSAHPDLVKIRWYLAQAYEYAGKLDEAIDVLEHNLLDQRAARIVNESLVATTLSKLATIYAKSSRRNSNKENEILAQTYAEEAYAIRQQVLPFGHADLTHSLAVLAVQKYKAGNLLEAVTFFEQVIVAYEQQYGLEHLHTIRIYITSAPSFYKTGREDEACVNLRKAIDFLNKTEDKIRRATAYSMYIEARTRQASKMTGFERVEILNDAQRADSESSFLFTEDLPAPLREIHHSRLVRLTEVTRLTNESLHD